MVDPVVTALDTAASPLLARHGAVPAEGPDAPVAWHYGDPVVEQRALLAGAAATDLSHRGVLRVTGSDRLGWLHSLTTQHLSGLAPGASTEALVLSPHGHVEHALHLVDDGEATWITVEPGTAPALAEWLDRMVFMKRVEVDDVTADWAVVGRHLGGDDPVTAVLPGLEGTVVWDDPWPAVGEGSVSYAGEGEHPALEAGAVWRWQERLVPRAGLAAALDGVPLAGTWAVDALRVAARRPRLGFETDHRTIPHELDWLRTAVHLRKGCYRGQETVARVHNLGRPPRRLVFLHLDGSGHGLPAAGAPVALGGRVIGRVTTPARHHELGPVALAVVKRSVPPAEVLDVEGTPAAQEVVVAP
ncbi:MAG: folate-binding protein [Kineosporiaceae bacterium]